VNTKAIFAGDGSLRVKAGDSAPGLAGSVITQLGEPSGDAVRATLRVGKGGVTAKDNEVLLGGLTSGALVLAARKGQPVDGLLGVTLKTILVFDGWGPSYFFPGQASRWRCDTWKGCCPLCGPGGWDNESLGSPRHIAEWANHHGDRHACGVSRDTC